MSQGTTDIDRYPRHGEARATSYVDGMLLVPAEGAFFYDDQAAIRAGAIADGVFYRGSPVTPGFDGPRMPAAAMSIGLIFGAGHIAWGDAMSVQYSGVGGRDQVFEPIAAARLMLEEVGPKLHELEVGNFRVNCEWLDSFVMAGGRRLPAALRYGISQALLRAAAIARQCTMAEIVHEDFHFPKVIRPVPVYAQSGDERYLNVDKMIIKRVDVLPHGLINSPAKFGHRGTKFLDYVTWVVDRISRLGRDGYSPHLHFDLYGTIGLEFGDSPAAILEFLGEVEKRAKGLAICIESPIDFGSELAQIEGYALLRRRLRDVGLNIRIAVDEWCNSLDDIRMFVAAEAADMVQVKTPDLGGLDRSILAIEICKKGNVGAFLGGSCVETDLSARASVHVAVATQADMQLAKPGMGVDEGLSIVRNEERRLLASLDRKMHLHETL